MSPSSTVLIAMPIFEGWEHVREALDSIVRQTHKNFRVLMSVDGGDQRSFDVCRPYTVDPRFELVMQPQRIYWEGNINWLAQNLREDFFCYWQHDDYCDPRYLEVLVDHANRNPRASSIYCDMQCFGLRNEIIRYPSVTGFALERVLKQATKNSPVVIRCLIRAPAMRGAVPVTLASTWALALAGSGELHRVEEVLYFRRLRADSLGVQMLARTPEELWAASLEWALGFLKVAHSLVQPHELLRLFGLIAGRIVNGGVRGRWQYDFSTASPALRLQFAVSFLSAAQERFGISPFQQTQEGNAEPMEYVRGGAEPFAEERLIAEAFLLRSEVKKRAN